MTNITAKAAHFVAAVRTFSLMAWWSGVLERTAVRLIAWTFSKRSVQGAFADTIHCNTPLGQELNSHIESCLNDISPDNIVGLSDEISNAVEEQLCNHEIEVDDIRHLDDAISEVVENTIREDLDHLVSRSVRELIDKSSDTYMAKLIAQRLSY